VVGGVDGAVGVVEATGGAVGDATEEMFKYNRYGSSSNKLRTIK
jgi:hypothetical protein